MSEPGEETRPSWVPPLTKELSNNKFLTKILLDGLKVPSGEICRTRQEARAAFARLDGAAVVKPVFGTEAKGVTLNITTPEACDRAFDRAQAEGNRDLVPVEDYVRGVDLRLLLLGETLIAAYLRLPAHVVGGAPVAMARIDYQPLFASGDMDTETLLRQALEQKRG